ncbi:gliding motility-associated lipoprotein GldB [Paenimyroides aquimaris]|uniref:Gliding motility-associated lipoprotein GldB n=1 Tax=Paenimyroides marinum TaxID=1159016 RepID=A0A1H6LGS3_9FLAO|nr:gliding motility lipoprotein GldB [Paenimyroides aquimaris]SEH85427.1 gliding motility-associated lipoprotein GldB [Paenimyroides aquimaris]
MKNIFYLFVCSIFFVACKKYPSLNEEIESVHINVKMERFDQEFMQVTPENFNALQNKYPYLLSSNIPDSVWFKKKNDTLFQELYSETEKKFSDLSQLQDDLSLLFKHIKYYYPNENPGKVITVLSEVDITNRAIYADSVSIISLDTYLGKEHKFYTGFDAYTLGDFEPNRIIVDLAENFALQKITPSQDRTFLSQMIFWGKITYLKQMLLPETSDALLMNYTEDQIKWAEANEAQMWKFFVESKYLYDNDIKLVARFIQRAPFSKFYLELDQESPGSVGVYIGWQIVRSYMKNNNVTLQELALKDAKTIFDQSKYKPKK